MISSNFTKSKRGGPQKEIKASANNSVISKPKIQVRDVFQLEKQMESQYQIKSEEFWIKPISKFALVMIKAHQF